MTTIIKDHFEKMSNVTHPVTDTYINKYNEVAQKTGTQPLDESYHNKRIYFYMVQQPDKTFKVCRVWEHLLDELIDEIRDTYVFSRYVGTGQYQDAMTLFTLKPTES